MADNPVPDRDKKDAPKSPASAFSDYLSESADKLEEEGADRTKLAEQVYEQADAVKEKIEAQVQGLIRHVRDTELKNHDQDLRKRLEPFVGDFEKELYSAKDDLFSKIDEACEAFDEFGYGMDHYAGEDDDLLEQRRDEFADAQYSFDEEISNISQTAKEGLQILFDIINDEVRNRDAQQDEEWQDEVDDLANELNSEIYEEDPEGAADDARIHNERLKESGNPYRLQRDEDGQWVYDIPDEDEDEAEPDSTSESKSAIEEPEPPLPREQLVRQEAAASEEKEEDSQELLGAVPKKPSQKSEGPSAEELAAIALPLMQDTNRDNLSERKEQLDWIFAQAKGLSKDEFQKFAEKVGMPVHCSKEEAVNEFEDRLNQFYAAAAMTPARRPEQLPESTTEAEEKYQQLRGRQAETAEKPVGEPEKLAEPAIPKDQSAIQEPQSPIKEQGLAVQFTEGEQANLPKSEEEMYHHARSVLNLNELAAGNQSTTAPKLSKKQRKEWEKVVHNYEKKYPQPEQSKSPQQTPTQDVGSRVPDLDEDNPIQRRQRQAELKQSIRQGEMRLESKVNSIGKRLSEGELEATRRAVEHSKGELARLKKLDEPVVPGPPPQQSEPLAIQSSLAAADKGGLEGARDYWRNQPVPSELSQEERIRLDKEFAALTDEFVRRKEHWQAVREKNNRVGATQEEKQESADAYRSMMRVKDAEYAAKEWGTGKLPPKPEQKSEEPKVEVEAKPAEPRLSIGLKEIPPTPSPQPPSEQVTDTENDLDFDSEDALDVDQELENYLSQEWAKIPKSQRRKLDVDEWNAQKTAEFKELKNPQPMLPGIEEKPAEPPLQQPDSLVVQETTAKEEDKPTPAKKAKAKSSRAKAEQGELVARSQPRERPDVDKGVFQWEYRVRELPAAEFDEMRRSGAVGKLTPYQSWVLEERRIQTEGEKREEGPWQTWQFGETKAKAIAEGIGDSNYTEAESLHPEHAKQVESLRQEKEAKPPATPSALEQTPEVSPLAATVPPSPPPPPAPPATSEDEPEEHLPSKQYEAIEANISKLLPEHFQPLMEEFGKRHSPKDVARVVSGLGYPVEKSKKKNLAQLLGDLTSKSISYHQTARVADENYQEPSTEDSGALAARLREQFAAQESKSTAPLSGKAPAASVAAPKPPSMPQAETPMLETTSPPTPEQSPGEPRALTDDEIRARPEYQENREEVHALTQDIKDLRMQRTMHGQLGIDELRLRARIAELQAERDKKAGIQPGEIVNEIQMRNLGQEEKPKRTRKGKKRQPKVEQPTETPAGAAPPIKPPPPETKVATSPGGEEPKPELASMVAEPGQTVPRPRIVPVEMEAAALATEVAPTMPEVVQQPSPVSETTAPEDAEQPAAAGGAPPVSPTRGGGGEPPLPPEKPAQPSGEEEPEPIPEPVPVANESAEQLEPQPERQSWQMSQAEYYAANQKVFGKPEDQFVPTEPRKIVRLPNKEYQVVTGKHPTAFGVYEGPTFRTEEAAENASHMSAAEMWTTHYRQNEISTGPSERIIRAKITHHQPLTREESDYLHLQTVQRAVDQKKPVPKEVLKEVGLAERQPEQLSGEEEPEPPTEATAPPPASSSPPQPPSNKPPTTTASGGAEEESKRNEGQVKPPWEMSPEEFAQAGIQVFKTAQGSLYAYSQGQTLRIKTPHAFHSQKDVGLKSGSVKTYFVNPKDATNLGILQTLEAEKKRIVVQGNQIIHTSPHPKTGKRGSNARIPIVSETPQIGLSPVELWDADPGLREKEGMQGTGEWYAGNHPGNAITEMLSPTEDVHRQFVEEAKKKGLKTYEPSATSPPQPPSNKPPTTTASGGAEEESKPEPKNEPEKPLIATPEISIPKSVSAPETALLTEENPSGEPPQGSPDAPTENPAKTANYENQGLESRQSEELVVAAEKSLPTEGPTAPKAAPSGPSATPTAAGPARKPIELKPRLNPSHRRMLREQARAKPSIKQPVAEATTVEQAQEQRDEALAEMKAEMKRVQEAAGTSGHLPTDAGAARFAELAGTFQEKQAKLAELQGQSGGSVTVQDEEEEVEFSPERLQAQQEDYAKKQAAWATARAAIYGESPAGASEQRGPAMGAKPTKKQERPEPTQEQQEDLRRTMREMLQSKAKLDTLERQQQARMAQEQTAPEAEVTQAETPLPEREQTQEAEEQAVPQLAGVLMQPEARQEPLQVEAPMAQAEPMVSPTPTMETGEGSTVGAKSEVSEEEPDVGRSAAGLAEGADEGDRGVFPETGTPDGGRSGPGETSPETGRDALRWSGPEQPPEEYRQQVESQIPQLPEQAQRYLREAQPEFHYFSKERLAKEPEHVRRVLSIAGTAYQQKHKRIIAMEGKPLSTRTLTHELIHHAGKHIPPEFIERAKSEAQQTGRKLYEHALEGTGGTEQEALDRAKVAKKIQEIEQGKVTRASLEADIGKGQGPFKRALKRMASRAGIESTDTRSLALALHAHLAQKGGYELPGKYGSEELLTYRAEQDEGLANEIFQAARAGKAREELAQFKNRANALFRRRIKGKSEAETAQVRARLGRWLRPRLEQLQRQVAETEKGQSSTTAAGGTGLPPTSPLAAPPGGGGDSGSGNAPLGDGDKMKVAAETPQPQPKLNSEEEAKKYAEAEVERRGQQPSPFAAPAAQAPTPEPAEQSTVAGEVAVPPPSETPLPASPPAATSGNSGKPPGKEPAPESVILTAEEQERLEKARKGAEGRYGRLASLGGYRRLREQQRGVGGELAAPTEREALPRPEQKITVPPQPATIQSGEEEEFAEPLSKEEQAFLKQTYGERWAPARAQAPLTQPSSKKPMRGTMTVPPRAEVPTPPALSGPAEPPRPPVKPPTGGGGGDGSGGGAPPGGGSPGEPPGEGDEKRKKKQPVILTQEEMEQLEKEIPDAAQRAKVMERMEVGGQPVQPPEDYRSREERRDTARMGKEHARYEDQLMRNQREERREESRRRREAPLPEQAVGLKRLYEQQEEYYQSGGLPTDLAARGRAARIAEGEKYASRKYAGMSEEEQKKVRPMMEGLEDRRNRLLEREIELRERSNKGLSNTTAALGDFGRRLAGGDVVGAGGSLLSALGPGGAIAAGIMTALTGWMIRQEGKYQESIREGGQKLSPSLAQSEKKSEELADMAEALRTGEIERMASATYKNQLLARARSQPGWDRTKDPEDWFNNPWFAGGPINWFKNQGANLGVRLGRGQNIAPEGTASEARFNASMQYYKDWILGGMTRQQAEARYQQSIASHLSRQTTFGMIGAGAFVSQGKELPKGAAPEKPKMDLLPPGMGGPGGTGGLQGGVTSALQYQAELQTNVLHREDLTNEQLKEQIKQWETALQILQNIADNTENPAISPD